MAKNILAWNEGAGQFYREIGKKLNGKPVKSDPLAGTYSNPVFTRVFDAQDSLWEYLKDIFTPLEEVELPRKVSPETIRQIRRLKRQGIKAKKLSEMFGGSTTTIRLYCRKKK